MVESAGKWNWSSARFHLGMNDFDPLVKDSTLLGLVSQNDWKSFLMSEEEVEEEELLKFVRTGRPAGDRTFIEKIEKITGMDLTLGQAGRPKKRKNAK